MLQLGHFTLLPNAFSLDRLRLATTNGGGRESFSLAGRTIDHGADQGQSPCLDLVKSSGSSCNRRKSLYRWIMTEKHKAVCKNAICAQ